jgi:hypothetical protein
MCWYCGNIISDPEPIGRSLRCSCGKDLRSCRHCRFYVSGSRGDCSETNAEVQADKERGNFCDWFSLNPRFRSVTAGEQKSREERSDAKAVFDGLFKN